MNNAKIMAKKVMHHIQYISGHIGPRPSGSQQEKEAQEYLAKELNKAGYKTEFQDFSFPTLPKFFPYLTLPSIFILIVPLLPGMWKSIFILLPFIIAGLPEIHAWLLDRSSNKSSSQNLIAVPHNSNLDEVDVLLCAHVDSGRNIPSSSSFFQIIINQYMVVVEVFSWLVAIIGLLYLSNPKIAKEIESIIIPIMVLAGFSLLWLDIWLQVGSRWSVSPGANDNASGVALCIAFAEEWMQNPDRQKLNVGCLFSGAEEAGLFGTKAFIQNYKNDGKQMVIINLDMIGIGSKIGAVFRSGRLKPLYTDSQLLQIAHNLIPDLIMVDYKYRGGDFIPFLKAGYRAISLEVTRNGGLPPTYHNESDTFDTIEIEALERFYDFLKNFIVKIN